MASSCLEYAATSRTRPLPADGGGREKPEHLHRRRDLRVQHEGAAADGPSSSAADARSRGDSHQVGGAAGRISPTRRSGRRGERRLARLRQPGKNHRRAGTAGRGCSRVTPSWTAWCTTRKSPARDRGTGRGLRSSNPAAARSAFGHRPAIDRPPVGRRPADVSFLAAVGSPAHRRPACGSPAPPRSRPATPAAAGPRRPPLPGGDLALFDPSSPARRGTRRPGDAGTAGLLELTDVRHARSTMHPTSSSPA